MSFESLSRQGSSVTQSPMALEYDLAMRAPDNWLSLKWYQKPFSSKGNEFCRIQNGNEDIERYIRCILSLPLKDANGKLRFGVWMSVSKDSWDLYRSGIRSEQYEKESCFGMLGNHLPHFGATFGLHADIIFGRDGERPSVFLHEIDHPLYFAQRDGLHADYIEKLKAKYH